jgi:hypothetical protein
MLLGLDCRVRNDPPSPTREAAMPGRASKRPRMHGGSTGRHERRTTPRRDRKDAEPDPGRAWARKGAQGPQRRGVPGGVFGPPRGASTLRPRLAAGRIPIHRHDMWWSTLNAAELDRRCPRPSERRLYQTLHSDFGEQPF